MTRVLITRPSPEAERWVAQLRTQHIDALALPLLSIGPVRAPALADALNSARHQCASGRYRALMFVSGQAVAAFFADGAVRFQPQQRFWSPGPGTARALRDAGVPPTHIDEPAADAGQFDSENLWAAVHTQIGSGDRVLIVRGASTDADGSTATPGGNGRDWLAAQIAAAGGTVDFVAAYERVGAALSHAAKDLAQSAASDGSVWLFSSSEALRHLVSRLPQTRWNAAHAMVTHPRIADAARAAGFGNITECRPTIQDVTASIKSLP